MTLFALRPVAAIQFTVLALQRAASIGLHDIASFHSSAASLKHSVLQNSADVMDDGCFYLGFLTRLGVLAPLPLHPNPGFGLSVLYPRAFHINRS
jgi:hypothetical protein